MMVGKLTGATKATDLTLSENFAAKATAIMHPMECATTWNEVKLFGKMTDFSIISTCSFNEYRLSLGLGCLRTREDLPRRICS